MAEGGRVRTVCCSVFVILSVVVSSASSDCPCEMPSLCEPIKTTPKKEIVVFSLTNSSEVWRNYNWSLVTTVVTVDYHNNDLMCLAHKHGVRVVFMVGYGPVEALANSTQRHIATTNWVKMVQQYYLDGINFDVESIILWFQTDIRDGYTALVNETGIALRALNPAAQVSIDVYCYPNEVGRDYDYAALAQVSDYFFIMDYEERDFTFAEANSDYRKTYRGVKDYLKIVDPSKLVVGVPWYGYDYICVELLPDNICFIYPFDRKRPVHDNEISMVYRHSITGRLLADQAKSPDFKYKYRFIGSKVRTYPDIMTILYKNSTTGRLWDDNAKSPYFNYNSTVDHKIHQIWYDDPESLTYKYKIVNSLNLGGAGVWRADMLNYTNTKEAQKMWGALSVIVN